MVKVGRNEERASEEAHRIAELRRAAHTKAERAQHRADEHARLADAEKVEAEKPEVAPTE